MRAVELKVTAKVVFPESVVCTNSSRVYGHPDGERVSTTAAGLYRGEITDRCVCSHFKW